MSLVAYFLTFTLIRNLDQKRLDPKGDLSPESLYNGDARGLVLESLYKVIKPKGRKEKKSAKKIISSNADVRVAKMILHDPSILGKTIPITFAVDDDIDSFLRGYIKRDTPESDRRINDKVINFVDILVKENKVIYKFSDYILTGSASRSPEIAGIKGALIGSILTLVVCFFLSFESDLQSSTFPPAFPIDALAPFVTFIPSTVTFDSIAVSPKILTFFMLLLISLFSFNVSIFTSFIPSMFLTLTSLK